MRIVGIFMMPGRDFKDDISFPKQANREKCSPDSLGSGNECVYVQPMDLLGRQPSACLRQGNTFLHCLPGNSKSNIKSSQGKTTGKPVLETNCE